jgi:hypothetical protein
MPANRRACSARVGSLPIRLGDGEERGTAAPRPAAQLNASAAVQKSASFLRRVRNADF